MTQDTREDERRWAALRGVAAILLGAFVAIVAVLRGDDSWAPILLAGASFAVGAGLLIFAFRS